MKKNHKKDLTIHSAFILSFMAIYSCSGSNNEKPNNQSNIKMNKTTSTKGSKNKLIIPKVFKKQKPVTTSTRNKIKTKQQSNQLDTKTSITKIETRNKQQDVKMLLHKQTDLKPKPTKSLKNKPKTSTNNKKSITKLTNEERKENNEIEKSSPSMVEKTSKVPKMILTSKENKRQQKSKKNFFTLFIQINKSGQYNPDNCYFVVRNIRKGGSLGLHGYTKNNKTKGYKKVHIQGGKGKKKAFSYYKLVEEKATETANQWKTTVQYTPPKESQEGTVDKFVLQLIGEGEELLSEVEINATVK